jgi:hypothetical protein
MIGDLIKDLRSRYPASVFLLHEREKHRIAGNGLF